MAVAEEYRDSCDGNESRWLISTVRDAVVREGRNSEVFHEGKASEQITVEAQRLGSEVVLSQKLPNPGRVIPELKATLWVRSERAGVRLYVHVLFPNQNNPRTGDILGALIEGSEYSHGRGWQQLVCETSDKAMQNQMRLLRASYKPISLDLRGSLIDRVVVVCTLGPGKTDIFLDDLRVGPLAAPRAADRHRRRDGAPRASLGRNAAGAARNRRPARLTIMLIDHGEQVEHVPESCTPIPS